MVSCFMSYSVASGRSKIWLVGWSLNILERIDKMFFCFEQINKKLGKNSNFLNNLN